MKKIITVSFMMILILSADLIYAQIQISGDARFRPRMDLDDRSEAGGTNKSDFYYMYRIRLNLKADIGDGYFLSTKLGHNGIAYYGKMATGLNADVFGAYGKDYRENGKRMSVDFMELYGGRTTPDFGFKIGLFGVNSFNNIVYDVHYLPSLMIDIPFFIFNTDALYGASVYFKAGPGKLTLSGYIDDARGFALEDKDGNEIDNINDQYTFAADYEFSASDWKLQPMVMFTVADSAAAPLTLGANLTAPKLGNFTLSAGMFYSTSSKTESEINYTEYGMVGNEYSAWKARVKLTGKLGPGTLTWFGELGALNNKYEIKPENNNDFLYSWLSYKFTIYKSDAGEFSIAPQWRLMKYDNDAGNLRTRNKLEVDFDFKF
ncbi:MAG: hypothetical protein KJ571_09675 [Bacteroidetes bacterium]|nr:hypothetical protein [Bacteroidota bacterium]